MLEIESLTVAAGTFRLSDVHLTVAQGACHAVLGPSGSGKSILLHSILGVRTPERGRIRLEGADLIRLPIERRGLGYVPQQLGLFPHLSVRENLAYSARARGIAPKQFQPLVEKLVAATDIGALLERRPNTLSGGERQRVGLVRALASQPRLILLDEPFTALNETLRREMWWLVKDLQRERGLAALLITHDLTEAHFLAENITILIDGRQEQSGDKQTIYRSPANLAVARFLGIKNLFPATVGNASSHTIEVDCHGLRHRFQLPGRAAAGTKGHLGIRAEDVTLLDPEHPAPMDACLLTGTIQRIDMGASVAMHFRSPDVESAIEIVASRQVMDRVGTANDSNRVTIVLRPSAMFWVPSQDLLI